MTKASLGVTAGFLGAIFASSALADEVQAPPPLSILGGDQMFAQLFHQNAAQISPQDQAMYNDIGALVRYMAREMPVVQAFGDDVQQQSDYITGTLQPLDSLLHGCPDPNVADYAIAAHWSLWLGANMFQQELSTLSMDPRFGDGHYVRLSTLMENAARHLDHLGDKFTSEYPEAQGVMDDLMAAGVIEESSVARVQAWTPDLGTNGRAYNMTIEMFPLQKFGPFSSLMDNPAFEQGVEMMLSREYSGADDFWHRAPRLPDSPYDLGCLKPR